MKIIIELSDNKSLLVESTGITEENIYEAIGLLDKVKFEFLNITKEVEPENER